MLSSSRQQTKDCKYYACSFSVTTNYLLHTVSNLKKGSWQAQGRIVLQTHRSIVGCCIFNRLSLIMLVVFRTVWYIIIITLDLSLSYLERGGGTDVCSRQFSLLRSFFFLCFLLLQLLVFLWNDPGGQAHFIWGHKIQSHWCHNDQEIKSGLLQFNCLRKMDIPF